MSNNPIFLDLDAFEAPIEVTVKLNGTRHKLKPVSVEDFISNTKLIQTLGASPDIETEIETVISLLLKAFPTMTRDELKKLEFVKLNAILDFANANNGQKAVEEKIEQENPPVAATS